MDDLGHLLVAIKGFTGFSLMLLLQSSEVGTNVLDLELGDEEGGETTHGGGDPTDERWSVFDLLQLPAARGLMFPRLAAGGRRR